MVSEPIYDPAKTYQENFDHGPFGMFANPVIVQADAAPKHNFLGMPVHLPFGIPAGPLLNGNYVKAALDMGYDLPVYKTVRTRRHPCHAWPNVLPVEANGDITARNHVLTASSNYSDPLSITNSFGVPSFDPDFWQPDIASAVAHARDGQLVIGSFQGTKTEAGGVTTYLDDFALGARLLKETGVAAVEVNLSCPNEGTNQLLCFDISRSREVVEIVQRELDGTPLLIKCAYFADDSKLHELVTAVAPYIHGIACINTISAEVRDRMGNQALPGEGRLWSGICGAGIRWAGLDMVARLARLRNDLNLSFAIIGCGGVTQAGDYVAYREAGADAVMSATGAMWHPQLAQQIKQTEAIFPPGRGR